MRRGWSSGRDKERARDRDRERNDKDRDRDRSRRSRSPVRKRSRRSRSRSSSQSRSRSRSISPDRLASSGSSRRRDEDYDKKKRRERRDKDSRRDRDKSPKVENIVGEVNYRDFDMDAQQKKLEILMQQRRERVEKWRAEQASKRIAEGESNGSTAVQQASDNSNNAEESKAAGDSATNTKKAWTLDDEFDGDDDEEEDSFNPMQLDDDRELKLPTKKEEVEETSVKTSAAFRNIESKSPKSSESSDKKSSKFQSIGNKTPKSATEVTPAPEDDDIDPLDAYMKNIQEEVKKLRRSEVKKTVEDKKVSVVVAVAKKSSSNFMKGELLEQNQDALEYSSEDEVNSAEDLAAMNTNIQNQATKTKKLLTISKEDITYLPFRKNFYIEVPELAKMTQEEVDAYREELEGIKVKGKGCPKPIKTWAQAGCSKRVMETLKRRGYEKPSPIQCQAIPAIMSGRDIIGIAKTGSGKTLAFLVPMFRHVLDQPPLEPNDGPIALIMTPTRELATQIWAECKKFCKYLGLRVVCVYGGTPISEQIGELRPGAEIVCCTPGRMIDMLAANGGRVTNLRRCTYVVLDEADRMFDMGFEPQVMRIIDNMRPDRQTVMFSATFPRIMEALARRILTKPIEIQVGGRSVVCKDVEQHVIVIEEEDKFLKLLELLGSHLNDAKSAIVFVDKQENADGLLKELMLASYTCLSLHGGIDQQDRNSIISDFKNNRVKVLIATSVAARGLDVKQCILVVNYDCPNHYEDYVHRCGRTGRAGNKGYAWTFVTTSQARYAGDIIKALELSGNTAPDDLKQLWDSYKAKAESEGKRVKSSSGFSGRGFKFDEAEAQLANERKKFQKAALGMQDSDEEDAEADIDQEIENMLASKKSVKNVVPVASGAAGASGSTSVSGSVPSSTLPNQPSNPNISEKLEMAKKLASKISGNIGLSKAQSTTEAFLKGEGIPLNAMPSVLTAKSIAEQRAGRLHEKLNYVPRDSGEYDANIDVLARRGAGDDEQGEVETFQRFEEELEINDFPQQARWRVTSKEALAQISEYSEAGITVRGTYIPPGKNTDNKDERKLYLAIEGVSELSVSKAKTEIIRLIKEELIKLQNSYQPINKGRYKVL